MFKKGQSGNPGGRKGIPEALRKKLDKALPIAIDQILKLCQYAESEEVRLRAANIILERQLGKPVQPVGNENPETPFLVKII